MYPSVPFWKGLYRIRATVKQSRLLIVSDRLQALDAALSSVLYHREQLEDYIRHNMLYQISLVPIKIEEDAPEIVRLAAEAAETAGVGPMAAVPGALADLAVEAMKPYSFSVSMVENGGEVAAFSRKPIDVGIYAGFSSISGKVGFRFSEADFPVGIATSSATVSHALSFGEADAAVIISDSASLSDAVATAVCNAVRGSDVEASVQAGLEVAEEISGVRAALIGRGRYVGKTGRLPRLLSLNGDGNEMFGKEYEIYL